MTPKTIQDQYNEFTRLYSHYQDCNALLSRIDCPAEKKAELKHIQNNAKAKLRKQAVYMASFIKLLYAQNKELAKALIANDELIKMMTLKASGCCDDEVIRQILQKNEQTLKSIKSETQGEG